MDLKIGDIVRGSFDNDHHYTGTVRGIDGNIAGIERDDGMRGGYYQNNLWQVNRINGTWMSDAAMGNPLEIISQKPQEELSMKNKTSKKINIEIYRQKGETYLEFSIPKEIEQIFCKKSSGIKESKGWPGLQFYLCPDITTNEQYKNKLRTFGLIDDFGTTLFDGNNLNIAFLRTVGGMGKIQVEQQVVFSIVLSRVKNMTDFLKEFYQDFCNDFSVKGSLTVEL